MKSLWLIVIFLFALLLIGAAGGGMVIIPGKSYSGALPPLTADEAALRERLRGHVKVLAEKIGERNVQHFAALVEAAQYIKSDLAGLGLPVRLDAYRLGAKEYVNIEAEVKGTSHPEEIVVVGAHYDSVFGSPGANDNASGVAAMLELARALQDAKPARTLRFVAFVNEEPPYFQGEQMGSMVYALRGRERKENVVAMLSLETIGYYSDLKGSQQYPAPLASFYPDTGNFIGFVGDLHSGKLLRRAIGTFRKSTQFPSEGVAAPSFVPGIGWSDNWSFWQAGYPALMITDTAPFRYPYYHSAGDTVEKLEYERMARVVKGLGSVVRNLVNE